MDKQHILNEIHRTAEANGGRPLGTRRFLQETGIKDSDWQGRHWVRWGDALQEAGFSPNELQKAFPVEVLMVKLAELIRELGHYPVRNELKIKSRSSQDFPSYNVFDRLGKKSQAVEKMIEFCESHEGFESVLLICEQTRNPATAIREIDSKNSHEVSGFVYLLKSGRFHKIGKSNAVGRRERELAIQLPERAVIVHSIQTDDPTGIEAYWHKRFESKRQNGEWFLLEASDIKAFKRRKFM